VSEICVALRKSEISVFRSQLEKVAKISCRRSCNWWKAGEHRQDSVANALAAISAAPDDIVLVHDAVRPFVTQEVIQEVITGAEQFGRRSRACPR